MGQSANKEKRLNIYPELDEDLVTRLLSLSSPHLRNLGWYLASRPLFFEGIPLTSNLSQNDWLYRDWDWFEEQDLNQEDVNLFIQKHQKNSRLGFYAENLLLFWFLKNSNFLLIENGTQISRDGKTITEIDFYFKELVSGQIFFWESTLKFYLWDDFSEEWIGPGSRDKARLKLKKVEELQMPEGIHYLKSHHSEGFNSELFVKGRLFSKMHPIFKWLHLSDFEKRFSIRDDQFQLLYKNDWMFMNSLHELPFLSYNHLLPRLHKEMKQKNKALTCVESQESIHLCFVVNDQWPSHKSL